MASTAGVGTGATITFGTNTTFTPQVTAINGMDISRVKIDTSHLGTTAARTNIPGDLYEGGSIELEIAWDPDDLTVDEMYTAAAETITIEFGNPATAEGKGTKLAFSGFVTAVSWVAPLEDKMTGGITVKVAGALGWTSNT